MRYGMTLPPFGALAEPAYLVELAQAAEAAGWDGFFLWDTVIHDANFYPVADPWIALAAVAAATSRIRIGVLLTPLPRRRPWQVARQAVTLDRLSQGRLIFAAGIGGGAADFEWFGEETDAKTRGRMLDEALEIVTRLWRGEHLGYEGEHYRMEPVTFRPGPAQSPSIPVWLGGNWPNRAPFRRAARYDGVFPLTGGFPPTVEEFTAIKAYIDDHRTATGPFDYAASGITPGDNPAAGAAQVAPYIAAGATWWLETVDPWTLARRWSVKLDVAAEAWMDARIRQPPPR
jgi:alkanesulfonate monooxygenase SsuD/methylene tetrahydromethanopterin reductase-like flavin-dependent oxidoreductase (luciferase family)